MAVRFAKGPMGSLVVEVLNTIRLIAVRLQVEASMVVVMIISPAGLLYNSSDWHRDMLLSVVSHLSLVEVVGRELVGQRFHHMFISHMLLVGVFLLNGAAEILLKQFLLGDKSLVWLQVG